LAITGVGSEPRRTVTVLGGEELDNVFRGEGNRLFIDRTRHHGIINGGGIRGELRSGGNALGGTPVIHVEKIRLSDGSFMAPPRMPTIPLVRKELSVSLIVSADFTSNAFVTRLKRT
jgi:hypothetical protein